MTPTSSVHEVTHVSLSSPSQRAEGPRAKTRLLRWLPLIGSLSLVAWVVSQVSLSELVEALRALNWYVIGPLTAALIVALYSWDSLCIWWLFQDTRPSLAYSSALRARGMSYLFTVLNYGAGQGFLAWLLAKRQDRPLLWAVTRCVMLSYADLCVLLGLGLIGASLSDTPRAPGIVVFCTAGLSLVGVTSVGIRMVPARRLAGVRQTRWGRAISSANWRWSRLLRLWLLRLIYTSFGLVYVAVSLAACGIELEPTVLVSVIPLVVLIDALPISVSGLGTREAALLYFLSIPQPAVLLAFSLVWSTSGIAGRALIGLANVGWAQLRQ